MTTKEEVFSQSSLSMVEQSIDDVLDCIRTCSDQHACSAYQRILKSLSGYLSEEYKLEIKKFRFHKNHEEASLLELMLSHQMRRIQQFLKLRLPGINPQVQ